MSTENGQKDKKTLQWVSKMVGKIFYFNKPSLVSFWADSRHLVFTRPIGEFIILVFVNEEMWLSYNFFTKELITTNLCKYPYSVYGSLSELIDNVDWSEMDAEPNHDTY